MLQMTIFLGLSLVVSTFEFPNHDLSPSKLEFSKLGDFSEGNLSVVLTIINELITHTNQSQEALRSNVVATRREKEVTKTNYESTKTTRRSACETLNTSDVLSKFHAAKEAEDDAKDIMAGKKQNYQDSLRAHEAQNVEFEIDSLHWINNLAHRLLTGSHMPTASPTTYPTLSPTKVPTTAPTPSPTATPTPPPTYAPITPALSNMFIRKHRRIYLHTVMIQVGLHEPRAIWIDSENNLICLGSCGLEGNHGIQWATKDGHFNYLTPTQHPDRLLSDDPLAYSWVRNESFKFKPLYSLEYEPRTRDQLGWTRNNRDLVSMWGKVDVTVPSELQTKKPVSVTYADDNQGLNVLFDDGSIWWKPGQYELLYSFLSPIREWDTDRSQWSDRRTAVDRMSAGKFPLESLNTWFKISNGHKFSRLSSGMGDKVNRYSFAWDENQDFYQFIGSEFDDSRKPEWMLFRTCRDMIDNMTNFDTTLPDTTVQMGQNDIYDFVKFPRECYVGEGNIVDVQYAGMEIWMLFDGNGGTGNLWLRGSCYHHEMFLDPSKRDGSYLESKRHPKLKDKKNGGSWCQFGQNRRVTTFTVSGNTLYIATPDGVFCIGDNYRRMCNHTRQADWLNWTEFNTSAFDGVEVAQMYAPASLWFLLTDGRIFNYHMYTWEMEEKFKEITSTNEIVDLIIQNENIILVNRTGSHYHRGSAPTNCIWTRMDSRPRIGEFNGTSNINYPEELVLCDGVADDLGYISDADLWL